jgi:hypothetical protein
MLLLILANALFLSSRSPFALAIYGVYLRGLTFFGNFALVGLSKCRSDRTGSGLALDAQLSRHQAETSCGVMAIVSWRSICKAEKLLTG